MNHYYLSTVSEPWISIIMWYTHICRNLNTAMNLHKLNTKISMFKSNKTKREKKIERIFVFVFFAWANFSMLNHMNIKVIRAVKWSKNDSNQIKITVNEKIKHAHTHTHGKWTSERTNGRVQAPVKRHHQYNR